MSKVVASLRTRGLRNTLALGIIRLKSFLELLISPTIWGKRVGLRSTKSRFTDAEVKQIYEFACDKDVLRWSGAMQPELSLEAFQAQLRRGRWKRQTNQRLFYIVTREDGIIGQVGLLTIDWNKLEGEFGILIAKQYWDKRYGREATDLFVRYIFAETPIRRIYLGTFKDNVRAQRSFAASGFRMIGDVKRFLPSRGGLVDGVEMELTR